MAQRIIYDGKIAAEYSARRPKRRLPIVHSATYASVIYRAGVEKLTEGDETFWHVVVVESSRGKGRPDITYERRYLAWSRDVPYGLGPIGACEHLVETITKGESDVSA